MNSHRPITLDFPSVFYAVSDKNSLLLRQCADHTCTTEELSDAVRFSTLDEANASILSRPDWNVRGEHAVIINLPDRTISDVQL